MGVVGFHPALLPNNRGRHPLIWAKALGLDKSEEFSLIKPHPSLKFLTYHLLMKMTYGFMTNLT